MLVIDLPTISKESDMSWLLNKVVQNPWSGFSNTANHSVCTRGLKITEKVSFNIASEASYVYILSGQKLIKNVVIIHTDKTSDINTCNSYHQESQFMPYLSVNPATFVILVQ